MNSIFLISIAIASSFLIFSVEADEKAKNATTVRRCYECTSVLHPGCADLYEGSEKFPHAGKLKYNYSKECSLPELQPYREPGKPAPVAVGCRKILQEVDGHTRVVRECAYTLPDGADEVVGLKRTGNQGVRLFYYQCPRDNCNGAARQSLTLFAFLAPLVLALVTRW